MKKSRIIGAALAVSMFTTAACGLVACDKEAGNTGKTPTTDKTYSITFDAGEGTLVGGGKTKTIKTDKNGLIAVASVPQATPANATDEFKGWSVSNSVVINFATYKFGKDGTVSAVYAPKQGGGEETNEFTIEFDYGDGTGTPASAKTVNGKLTSLPTPQAPANFTFDHWYTAETDGTEVTTDTVFSEDGKIFARYTPEQGVVTGDFYCTVGAKKYELVEATPTDSAERKYTVSDVEMNEGDTIQFTIDGDIVEAWPGFTWNGLQKSTKSDMFTAARQGTFDFDINYYPADEETGAEATWSVNGDDGQAPEVPERGEKTAVDAEKCFMVGKLDDGTEFDPDNGYEVSAEVSEPDAHKTVQFKVVVHLTAGEQIKFRYKTGWTGYLENNSGSYGTQLSNSGDNNIDVNESGTYTFYVKFSNNGSGNGSVWVDSFVAD